MNSLRNLTMNLQRLMHGGIKFQDGMHPVGLYLDLKTLQLDLDETKAQNGHAVGCEIFLERGGGG